MADPAPVASCVSGCGGAVQLERVAPQYQEDLPVVHADHLSTSASINSPGAPPGPPPAPSTARPRPSTAWARSPSTGAGSTPCPASPTASARIPPRPAWLLRAPRIPPSSAPTCPPRGRTSSTSAYYSGWRKNEILGLTWDEIDEAGGVIRLSPARSKTLVARMLPISQSIAEALARRRAINSIPLCSYNVDKRAMLSAPSSVRLTRSARTVPTVAAAKARAHGAALCPTDS